MNQNKTLVLGLIIIFCTTNVIALTSNQTSFDVDVTIGEEKEIDIRLTNNEIYDLYNLRIVSDYMELDPINISSGETKTATITILTSAPGSIDTDVTILAYQKKSCAELGQTTYDINVTGLGVDVDELNICPGDPVQFNNFYSPYIEVTIFGTSILDDRIDVDNSKTYTAFDSVGNYHFEIFPLIGDGDIIVSETEVFVHNADDDEDLSFDIESSYEDTTIDADLYKNNFTLEYDEAKNNYVVLENIGSKTAYNITLSGDWFISFDKNNFNLTAGDSIAVNFMVSPVIFDEDDTNKSYFKKLKIEGNFPTIEKDVNIFVNYSALDDQDIASWWESKKNFCDNYPTSPYCVTEPIVKEVEVPKYDCPSILAEMDPEDVREVMQSIIRVEDGFMTFENWLKQLMFGINGTIELSGNSTLSAYEEAKRAADEARATKILFIVLIVFTLFLVIFAVIAGAAYIIKKRRGLQGYFK